MLDAVATGLQLHFAGFALRGLSRRRRQLEHHCPLECALNERAAGRRESAQTANKRQSNASQLDLLPFLAEIHLYGAAVF
jgi:hypothetical protein